MDSSFLRFYYRIAVLKMEVAMQKWQYMTLRASWTSTNLKITHINGVRFAEVRMFEETKSATLYDFLNDLGQDGWEVVGFSSDMTEAQNLILKRPLP
jgi:hypothetical protein